MDQSIIVGRNIRKYRLERGWRLKDVADMLSISQSVLSEYERGNKPIPIGLIVPCCELFEVSLNELFSYIPLSSCDKKHVHEMMKQINQNASHLSQQIKALNRYVFNENI